jgi:hypothetical protein
VLYLFNKYSFSIPAIPDLIRYVHGNILGINKLVRGFRTLWHKKMHPVSSVSETPQPEQADALKNGTPPPAANNTDQEVAVTSSPVCDKIPESEHAMSIRQLDLKISSIATYKKGPQHYRKCWYVNPETLKEYNLEELQEKVVKKELNKSMDKKDLNKSIDGSQVPCATPEASTPKAKTTPSVTITQFTVKADPDAKWQLEKLTPKPAPATPGPLASSPAPTKVPARRIQLTTLASFMKPKLVQCASAENKQNNAPSVIGMGQSDSSDVRAKSGACGGPEQSLQLNKEKSCQVIDLTEELSNDASTQIPGSGVSGIPTSHSLITPVASNDVEMADASAVVVVIVENNLM